MQVEGRSGSDGQDRPTDGIDNFSHPQFHLQQFHDGERAQDGRWWTALRSPRSHPVPTF